MGATLVIPAKCSVQITVQITPGIQARMKCRKDLFYQFCSSYLSYLIRHAWLDISVYWLALKQTLGNTLPVTVPKFMTSGELIYTLASSFKSF